MSGVLIEGGWRQGSGKSIRSDPAVEDALRQGAASTAQDFPTDQTASAQPVEGEVIPFPPFSHPSFGFPDFAVSAKRRRSARRRFRRRVVASSMAGALLFGTTGIVAANEIGTHSALASARTALSHTRQQLTAVTSQRDSYEAQLRQAQDQLSSAQSQLNLQGSQITVLKTCLNGVLDSLSYAANNDYTNAISTINSVSGACNSASAVLSPPTSTA